jgi:hypothetical protein
MSTAEWTITKRIRINANLQVDLTIGPSGACDEWIGGEPKFLTDVERRRYRDGRDALVAELARKMHANIAVVEI